VSQEDFDAAVAAESAAAAKAVGLSEQLEAEQTNRSAAEAGIASLEDDLHAITGDLERTMGDLAVASADLEQAREHLVAAQEERTLPLPKSLTVAIRGTLRCGVGPNVLGFATPTSNGDFVGFDADFCRAVAAAVLGDADKVEFVPLSARDRFIAVSTGDVDVLFRNTTHTLARDSELRMDFGPTTFYDGQRLMGRRDFPLDESSTFSDLDGAVVCSGEATAARDSIVRRASDAAVTVSHEHIETMGEALDKFKAGTCDIVSTDTSALVGIRQANGSTDDWVIFPADALMREPLGPVYQSDDSLWADIVNWVVYTTILAESKGISSTDLGIPAGDAEAARLLGTEGSLASQLGLADDAFYQVIRQVGNYGEIYDRNIAPLGLSREGTFNDLAENGGLLYAPPAR
jgi:general L-amino acid transport system substrate-binding protein